MEVYFLMGADGMNVSGTVIRADLSENVERLILTIEFYGGAQPCKDDKKHGALSHMRAAAEVAAVFPVGCGISLMEIEVTS